MKLLPLIFFVLIQNVFAQQKTNISITPAICKQTFTTEPFFQAINGILNIALNLCNGVVFQFNNIPLKQINYNALINNKVYKTLLIDEINQKTYKGNAATCKKIKITCSNDNKLIINFTGNLYCAKNKLNIKATIVGAIPTSNEIKTNNEKPKN